jgi:hypothetical protein
VTSLCRGYLQLDRYDDLVFCGGGSRAGDAVPANGGVSAKNLLVILRRFSDLEDLLLVADALLVQTGALSDSLDKVIRGGDGGWTNWLSSMRCSRLAALHVAALSN